MTQTPPSEAGLSRKQVVLGKGINLQNKSCGEGFLVVQKAILDLTMGEEQMLSASLNLGSNNCEDLQDSPQA